MANYHFYQRNSDKVRERSTENRPRKSMYQCMFDYRNILTLNEALTALDNMTLPYLEQSFGYHTNAGQQLTVSRSARA
ncbi:unnamed protein product [Adineta ricciae]|uniref:Uncharacterized protein n=1 Tax=Adineta ricciae TaxID=249248 RepID=A0A816HQH9_ADIRI|nr:unnamed protein product [Adineta ricciae]